MMRAFLVFPLLLTVCLAATPYTYGTYSSIFLRMQKAAKEYPQFVKLYSAQKEFSLPSVGDCTLRGKSAPCEIWYVEVTNFKTLKKGIVSRPQMMISGEVHGNERVGPQVSIAFLELLLQFYGKDRTLTRIIDNTYLTIIPMANAIGYELNEREEIQGNVSYDINRDFAFDQVPEDCMRTVAARAINELFRTHLYSILMTFHGGINTLTYNWGDTINCDERYCLDAPDVVSMSTITKRMADYAGPAGPHEKEYVIGDTGGVVYPVTGGMEDWAYGASWFREKFPCKPKTLGGYPVSKTEYSSGLVRAITYLVETADDKEPPENTLGTNAEPLVKGGKGDGHVPRNLRLLVAISDALLPYVQLTKAKAVGYHLYVEWIIGGAFFVEDTKVEYTLDGGKTKSQTKLLFGLGSFTKGGVINTFKAKISACDATKVYYRVIAKNVDRSLGVDIGFGATEAHYSRMRTDPKWLYVNGKFKVKGKNFYKSATKMVDMKTGISGRPDKPLFWNDIPLV